MAIQKKVLIYNCSRDMLDAFTRAVHEKSTVIATDDHKLAVDLYRTTKPDVVVADVCRHLIDPTYVVESIRAMQLADGGQSVILATSDTVNDTLCADGVYDDTLRLLERVEQELRR